jgi:type I restriction enzyme S subunit
MKKGWQTKKIGEVCDLATGGTPSRTKPEYFGGDIKWLVSGDIHHREIFNCEGRITKAGMKNSNAKLLPVNSVMIALNGQGKTRGTVALLRTPATCNQSMVSITPKLSSGLLPEFLYANLHGRYEEIRRMTSDDDKDRRGLNMGLIRSIEIPIAPPSEQERIVSILDKAFEGIATAKANTEKNLQNARAIFESHLQFILRNKKWKWKTLGDLCDGVEYGSSAKSEKDGKIPVLRMGNIQDGKLDWKNLAYTSDKEEIAKYLLKHNDVLFNRTNSPELVGKTAIYKGEMPAIFAGYLIRIRRKEDFLDADFLNYFLNSQIAFDYGKSVVISSVNQANINGAKLKGYPIPAPSLAEQKVIVAQLDALSKETQLLIHVCERKLAALEALKKSLLHQAFTGEL